MWNKRYWWFFAKRFHCKIFREIILQSTATRIKLISRKSQFFSLKWNVLINLVTLFSRRIIVAMFFLDLKIHIDCIVTNPYYSYLSLNAVSYVFENWLWHVLWYIFYPLEVQLGFCGLKKKGCSRGRCWGRRSRPPGKRKEDEAHFYIHFDIEISSSFYCLMVFCIVKNDVFSWPPVRGGGQNGLKTRNTIYLYCIKAIRFYDISFSEFSTKWLLSWKRNNFGKIELVRMVQIALKWQFCSKYLHFSFSSIYSSSYFYFL